MAEFFTSLVPSGPGAMATSAAAAGMVSFAASSSPGGDSSSSAAHSHGSPSPHSSGGDSDSPSSSSKQGNRSSSLFGGLSLNGSSKAGAAASGNVLSTSSDSKDGTGIHLSSQPGFFQQFSSGSSNPRFNTSSNNQASSSSSNANATNQSSSNDGLQMDEEADDDDDDDLDVKDKKIVVDAGKNKDSKPATAGSQQNKQALSSAERRATHNAIERARRESLNGRFMQLASSLPSMANVKRPSKSIIVNKSLEYIQESVIREHTLVKENTDLRREVDELRARLGMPPLPPAAPATMTGHHLTAVATPQLVHPHHVAPGAATIPPELPAHALHAFRPYSALPHNPTPFHLPIHRHSIPGVPGFSITPEAAALLSPTVFHPHAAQLGGQQPHLREDPFDSTATRQSAALHHGYAGAIMGNPPAMTSPTVNNGPQPSVVFSNGTSGVSTPKAAPAEKSSSSDARRPSNSKKRPSPDAEDVSPANKKRAVLSSGPHSAESDGPVGMLKTVRSGSISSESSSSTSSSGSPSSAHQLGTSPFLDPAQLQHMASAHQHSLTALGIDVPISQAFGAMGHLGLMGHHQAGLFGSSPEQHQAIFSAVSAQPTSQPHSAWFHQGAESAASQSFGLFAA